MKEILQTFFKNTEERIKNPFISAFFTSWIIFNWKPILLIFFSEKNIEEKIDFITINYNDINHFLWFPLISSLFYILILPYINLFFDIIIKYSNTQRNNLLIDKQKQLIENKKLLAIEEIKFEEAKTEYRERNNHNKLVEELQEKYRISEVEKENLKNNLNQHIEQLKSEINEISKVNNSERLRYDRRNKELYEEINKLNEQLNMRNINYENLMAEKTSKVFKISLPTGKTYLEIQNGDNKKYLESDSLLEIPKQKIDMYLRSYKYDRIEL